MGRGCYIVPSSWKFYEHSRYMTLRGVDERGVEIETYVDEINNPLIFVDTGVLVSDNCIPRSKPQTIGEVKHDYPTALDDAAERIMRNSTYGYPHVEIGGNEPKQSLCECGALKTYGEDCHESFHYNWCPCVKK